MTGASRPSVRVGKRALAALAAGSIAVPLSFGMMGGTAFAATAPPPTDIQGICPTGQVPDSSFPDTQNDFFKDAINCLVAYGVTQGYPDGTYKPSLDVNREQMALFFYRVGKYAGFSWNTSDAGFKDINTASSQEAKDAINALANAGIVQGFTDGTYRPANVVQRDAMAKYIANTVKTLGGPDMTNSTNDYFVDDEGNTFENYINGIAQGTITNGIDATHYGPGLSVHRDEMAGFITRSMEVLYKAGKLKTQYPPAPASNQAYTVSPATNTSNTVQAGQPVTYTVSNVPAGTPVDVAIYTCAQLNHTGSGATGNPTFNNSSNPGGSGNVAPTPASAATITAVNGAAPGTGAIPTTSNGNSIYGVTSNNGTLTVTYTDSTNGECTVPVVYKQVSSTNNNLPLGTDNSPSVPYGAGGQTTMVPPEATAGAISNGSISSPTGTSFVANNATYYYNSNDVYQLVKNGTCQNDTYSDFQQRLSSGDTMATGSNYNPRGSTTTSTFCLNDVAPQPPAAVTAHQNSTTYSGKAAGTNGTTGANGNGGINVSWTPSPNGAVTAYNVYRAAATQNGPTGTPFTCPTYTNASTASSAPQPGVSPQTPPTSPYTMLASVPATANNATPTTATGSASGTYVGGYFYNDTTATGTTLYCYAVSSVSPAATGDQVGTARESDTNATATSTTGGQTLGQQGIAGSAAPTSNTTTPAFTSAVQTAANAVTVTYNTPIDCKTVDGSTAAQAAGGSATPAAWDYTVQSSTTQNPANGTSTAQTITGVTCNPTGGSYTPPGGTAQQVGQVVIATSGSFPADQYIVVTAKVGTDGNTVANSSDTANQAAGDQVVTSSATTAPTIASVTQDTAANTLDFTYNEPVKCGDGTVAAAANYKISTDTGSTCQNVTMSGNTGTAATAGSTNVIQVTFASAFTPGSYSVTYTKPGSPTTTNATYDPVNGLFAPSQTVTGVTVS